MSTNALKDVLLPVNCIWLWDSSRACLNLKIIKLKPLSVQEKKAQCDGFRISAVESSKLKPGQKCVLAIHLFCDFLKI